MLLHTLSHLLIQSLAMTSCEMRNDYLDRALVVPVPGLEDAAFFRAPG